MGWKLRIILVIVGVLAWLGPPAMTQLSVFWCETCATAKVAASTSQHELPAERVSQAGVHYGQCDGITFAVMLFPEPCGWEEKAKKQMLASR
jgi:hypothetical protein